MGAPISTAYAASVGTPASQLQTVTGLGDDRLELDGFTVDPILAHHSVPPTRSNRRDETVGQTTLDLYQAALDPFTPEETASLEALNQVLPTSSTGSGEASPCWTQASASSRKLEAMAKGDPSSAAQTAAMTWTPAASALDRAGRRRPGEEPAMPLTDTPAARRDAMPRAWSISAVLPAYNEEALIEQTVLRVAGVLADLVADFEIVVTNDGSRDRTGEVLARLQHAQPELHLRVVTHSVNQGYGAALASGFDAAEKELVLLLDADGQFEPAELISFLAAMDEHADLVIGWRRQRADPPLRLLNAFGWKLLISVLFGATARDVDCAFKLFRRRVWESLTVHARGATFSAEFLIKARRLGFRIRELPVSHYPRTAGIPTGARPRVIVRAFKELVQLRRRLEADLAADRGARALPGHRHAMDRRRAACGPRAGHLSRVHPGEASQLRPRARLLTELQGQRPRV